MKAVGKISLFFICGIILFGSGVYAGSLCEKWFYPNKNMTQKAVPERGTELKWSEIPPEMTPYEAQESEEAEHIQVNQKDSEIITCDTVLEIEEYDKNMDSTVTHEESVQGKYIGMDRTEFVESMDLYAMSPPLEEQKRGLISVEVLSFSRERIRLRKDYQVVEEPAEPLFYLTAENHYVVVYKEDMQNVYLYTDILLEDLPVSVQEEIIQRKLISGEGELYHFLESYTS
ncbi:MAG: hypothetical protein ACI4SZ_08905 [Lachnospiraceae bacterium]